MPKYDLNDKDPEQIQKILSEAWLNIDVDENSLFNPLETIPDCTKDNPSLYYAWLMTQPEYFSFVCKELLNINLLPIQAMMLQLMWNHKLPILLMSRGAGKSFSLAIYALLRALLMPGRKVMLCGAAFRQSKIIYDYILGIMNGSPILQSIVAARSSNGHRAMPDMHKFHLDGSSITAIPIGHTGDKIRGQRANDVICDEFDSVPLDVFEIVIRGFTAVAANVFENVKFQAKKKLAKKLGQIIDMSHEDNNVSNQVILSGTCGYDFGHFAKYWKRYCAIIKSKGDPKKIIDYFPDGVDPKFNWKDYAVIRIPIELMPDGFMDDAMIANTRATTQHIGNFEREYCCIFSKDSQGFYKRTLMESCTVSPTKHISLPSEEDIVFEPSITGIPSCRYVFGVDPASENDNFAITILELKPDNRRVKYVWTINKRLQRERIQAGITKDHDYYAYCARKIRDLMHDFPCERIALDSQGGGIAIMEALRNKNNLKEGELPILPIIDPDNERDTDAEAGLHIIEIVNFAKETWTSEANHGLKFDMESKTLLFPHIDAVELAISQSEDTILGRTVDTLEDCIFEIEELKAELATIVMTKTPSGRDKWDTPETKLSGNKKGRLRKDRYSALLMANMTARNLNKSVVMDYEQYSRVMNNHSINKSGFIGPAWFTEKINGVYGDDDE